MANRKARKRSRMARKTPRLPFSQYHLVLGDSENDYERFSNRTVKTIFNNRGLRRPLQFYRRIYIQRLRATDEQFRFRFADLPLELQRAVYSHCELKVHWPSVWGHSPRNEPLLPRICEVSRQIRTEALPMSFVSADSLMLEIGVSGIALWQHCFVYQYPSSPAPIISIKYPGSPGEECRGLNDFSHLLLGRLTDEHLRHVTKIEICVWPCPHTHDDHRIKIMFKQDRSTSNDTRLVSYDLDTIQEAIFHTMVKEAEWRGYVASYLPPVLDKMVADGEAGLSHKLLSRILDVFTNGPCWYHHVIDDASWEPWMEFWDGINEGTSL